MQNNFDLKKFLVENKLTPQSQTISEEEEEFTIDAPSGWNPIYLTVGDTIKSDYWDYDKDDTMWFGKEPFRHPDYTIVSIKWLRPWTGNEPGEYNVVLNSTAGKGGHVASISNINSRLLPQYEIVPPDSPELKYR